MREIIRTFYSPDKGEIPPFYLEMAGISYCDGSYWMQRKCSTETVFEYVTAGRGNLTVNGETYEASAGNIWLLRQKTDHYYRSSSDEPWIKIFFNIRGSLAEQIINEYPIKDKVIFDGAGFEDDFNDMLQNLKDDIPLKPNCLIKRPSGFIKWLSACRTISILKRIPRK